MNKPPREALDAYFAEADSWARDRQEALRSSRNVAWIVATVAAAIALFEAIALLALMPLKTVVPYTLMVDRQTGFVQELKPVDAQLVSSRSALTQSFLVQYVIAREGFDPDALQSNYRKVALWSSGAARQAYVTSMQASNPASPLVLYPRSNVVDVQVKSVTPLGSNVAMVRFQTQRHDAGGHDFPAEQWVSVIRYTWSDAPMSAADRYLNPLGFEVTRYERSAETLPQPEPTTNAASAPLSAASANAATTGQ
jgi:type IV secretion system protein VirB8